MAVIAYNLLSYIIVNFCLFCNIFFKLSHFLPFLIIITDKDYHILKYGGPDGELGASLRYLSQRFTMPMPELKATLTDIGTEELNHLEMIGAIVYQLTKNSTPEEIQKAGLDAYFVDHTLGIYPASAAGVPFTAAYLQSKGDAITDLHENMGADEKAIYALLNLISYRYKSYFFDYALLYSVFTANSIDTP